MQANYSALNAILLISRKQFIKQNCVGLKEQYTKGCCSFSTHVVCAKRSFEFKYINDFISNTVDIAHISIKFFDEAQNFFNQQSS